VIEAAPGKNNQKIHIVPSRGWVIVRMVKAGVYAFSRSDQNWCGKKTPDEIVNQLSNSTTPNTACNQTKMTA